MTPVQTSDARCLPGAAAVGALLIAATLPAGTVKATPAVYEIDPNHTHPMFEVDHYGTSVWRGLFRKTRGTITLDATKGTGTVDIAVDTASVDFGNEELNDVAANGSAPPILEAAKYPTAHYTGTLGAFTNRAPTMVTGFLTLHGVTQPLVLTIGSFKCLPNHPLLHREVCGADAMAKFNRADFGITVGRKYGFNMDVTLRIQVEAIRAGQEPTP